MKPSTTGRSVRVFQNPGNKFALPNALDSEIARSPRRRARAALRTAKDLNDCLNAVEAALRTYPKVDGYLINLHHPDEIALTCARLHLPPAFSSVEHAYSQYAFALDGQDATAVAFATGTIQRVSERNIKDYSTGTQGRFVRWEMRSLVAFPIQAADTGASPVGTLTLFSQQCVLPGMLVTSVRELMEEAAPLISLHRKAADLEANIDTIRGVEKDLKSLLHFLAELNSLTTDREIYPRIEREFIARFELDFAAVLMHEDGVLRCADTRFVPPEAKWGKAWQAHCAQLAYSLDYCDSASSDAFANNRPLYFADIPSLLNLPMSKTDKDNLEILKDLKTFAVLPIRKHGKPIGVLWLGSMRRLNALSTDDLVLIQHLCDFLGSVIDNARVYTLLTLLQNRVEALDTLASRDKLTGLHNYGSFEIEMGKRLQAHREHPKPSPISLVMCDVDHFKRFNDTHGHVIGNAILQTVAQRIGNAVRDSDFVARYGGDEFAILLSRCDIKTATLRAERIRHAVANEPLMVDGVEYAITLSLGCAELGTEDDGMSLITKADTALYAAKRAGRDRIARSTVALGAPHS